jgi:hypothetical protein
VPTSDRSRDRGRQQPEAPAERAADAVARARRHAQTAIAEVLAALGALLDASSLAMSGELPAESPLLGPIARILDGLRAEFDSGAAMRDAAPLLHSIAEALDAEIARWEARAESDVEARSVLRAFLGLRELLWEFGIRRQPEASERASAHSARKPGRAASAKSRKSRVQRITVEG